MKVYLKPMFGSAKTNVKKAETQLEKALGFRGKIKAIKVENGRIVANIRVNSQWDLSAQEKVKYLRSWLPSRVYFFDVKYR